MPIPEGDAQNFLQFQINAPRANNTQALFITVFFRDRANGYLKASWETDAGQNYLLSENLFEGTGVPNQRSFLISSDRITNTNTLIFEAQENIDALIKVQFQWVSAETIHIIPEEHPSEPKLLLVDSNNKTYSQHDLSGEPQQPTVDYWQGRVINAAVIETYARIDEGVRFFVTLEKQPLHARIQTQIIGPALLDRIGVWVNDQYAGILNIEVPSLATSGIFERPNRQAYFAGWRQGTIYIDPKLLDSGENSILFEIRRRDPRDIFPIHIKDFYLQLAY
ncbi:MAG: hypothetical protein NZM04_08225 [Methylacidiphilales bacterium]|nr:hypothetical protein [Candidatus Methylacidiphilales bacterium]